MNKQLKLLQEKYSLKEYENNVVYGVINDYQVIINLSNMRPEDCFVVIYSNFSENRVETAKFIDFHKKDYKLRICNFTKSTLTFDHMAFGQKGWVEKAEKIILEITEFLKSIGAKDSTYCPACGEKIDFPTEVVANGLPVTLCSKCAAKIQVVQQKQEEEYQAAPGNYGKGLLGAAIGALIGGIVWVAVAALLNIVSAFIAVLISYLASIGYDKMKGKQNKVKTLIIIAVSIVVVAISMYLSYVVMVDYSLKVEGIDANAFEAFALLLREDSEFLAGFVGDMFLSLLFGVLGIIAYVQQMKKKLHK